jgi:hypothetical protein
LHARGLEELIAMGPADERPDDRFTQKNKIGNVTPQGSRPVERPEHLPHRDPRLPGLAAAMEPAEGGPDDLPRQ